MLFIHYLQLTVLLFDVGTVIEFAKKKAVTEAYKNAFSSMAIILLRSGKVAIHFLDTSVEKWNDPVEGEELQGQPQVDNITQSGASSRATPAAEDKDEEEEDELAKYKEVIVLW